MTDTEGKLADAAYEASVRLDRARAALRMLIDRFDLDSTDMTQRKMNDICSQINMIYTILEIVDDYMFDANKELEQALDL